MKWVCWRLCYTGKYKSYVEGTAAVQFQPIVAMGEYGPSVIRASKFSREAVNPEIHVKNKYPGV